MIGVVTDSGSQLPSTLAEQLGIVVVPLWVVLDGEPCREGVDLDADAFWARVVPGRTEVTTSQPSPGELQTAYEALEAAGARRIVSVHTGSDHSGTVNSARLAAEAVGAEVTVVDTATASFGVAVAAIEVAVSLAEGASVERAVLRARATLEDLRNVFLVGGLDLVRSSGKVRVGDDDAEADGQPVLELRGGELVVHATVSGSDDAVGALADAVLAGAGPVHVAVGVADDAVGSLGDALAQRLAAAPWVVDVTRYRVGPSVGAHTGPGTVGAFWWPASDVG